MTESSLRRHTAIFGLVATLISLTDIPLYFMYTGAPPQWDILTRVLVGIVSSTILIVFLVGFRLVICQGRPQLEWAATLVLVSGVMWLTFSMVAQSMEAGTAIVSKIPIDPTVDGVLAPGQFLLWGAIGRLMTALFLLASGLAILQGRFTPAWLAWLAFVIALINLAFVPAVFFGHDASQFYSAVGWGTTAMAPVLVVWWIIIASIIMLRTPAKSEA